MLTVMFATLNRAALLREVLASFALLRAPRGGWRLVIVDNGSTDDTREVVQSFESRLPIRFLYVAEPGKNAALNAGLAQVEGDLVILTDDDVFPSADWLLQMRAAADARPDVSVFGGAIVPRWAEQPATWLLEWAPKGPVFTITDPAQAEGSVGSDRVFGPNMAVRAAVFAAGIRFDPDVGPRGASYPMGSETEFVERLVRGGYKVWFVPGAKVEHFIRKTQMERAWVMRRAVLYGRGQYRLGNAGQPAPPKSSMGVPRYLFRQLAQSACSGAWARITLNEEARFRAQWTFNYVRGQVIEARSLHLERQARGAALAQSRMVDRK